MKRLISIAKNLLFFNEPKESRENFILKETEKENNDEGNYAASSQVKFKSTGNGMQDKSAEGINGKEKNSQEQKPDISKKLSENLDFIKNKYSVPINSDIVIRDFDIIVKDKVIPAFMVFFDGMVDRKVINDNILQPLMLLSNLDIKDDAKNIPEFIKRHLLTHNQFKEARQLRKVIDEINFGGCGIFMDGVDSAFVCDVKGWEHRSVERPNTELIIRGPQEGFTENIRTNTALIRRRVKDEDLIIEAVEIGKRSKTPCAILYIKDIVNEKLVNEVRRRIKSIKIDYLHDSGELEQFIEDGTFMPAPQITATERPDRVAAMLDEGKVAVLVNGSPFALVLPATFHELLYSPEDSYVRFPYANLLRFVRILAIIFSLLLPGMYVAITNYHQEMIPTELLLAIEASREKVPFPSLVEILIMEFSFELIREAGIRIPGPIGPTLGIIGALILGQAAVAANIVSPVLIIIVAVTGIGSFAIPNFSLAFAFRILRFLYILLGAIAGFLGIAAGLLLQFMWLVSTKSFGVPYFVPFAPKTAASILDSIVRAPVWKQERRPDYMNTKDNKKQSDISRGWIKPENGGNKNGSE